MTDRQKYDIYNDMYNKSFNYTKALTDKYEKSGYTVYTVFIAVSDELTRTYFVEIEIGGSPEKYKHIRKTMTETELIKLIG